jgi:DNA-binding NarL/FixJ family response regulator
VAESVDAKVLGAFALGRGGSSPPSRTPGLASDQRRSRQRRPPGRIDLSTASQPIEDRGPAATLAFGLTDRELDVLRLLGQGKTNPEIAAALFISPRTAGVHVTNILRKLDATTRVQAATIADRAGLLSAESTRPGAT